MTANRTAPFFARLQPTTDEPDAELIRRFVSSRDATAFEQLVRRHGPLVFGICQRTLGQTHDAEDAFQAIFLVLAQKAHTLRDPNSLSAWLYGVAVRVSKKAKARAATRREETNTNLPEPMAMARETTSELAAILDEELAALAEHYRQAILLCDVQELSRTEAATKLGIPEGTLSSRLAKGRKLLAARLHKRGITLVVPLTGLMVTAVPEKLIGGTVEMLQTWLTGGVVPSSILELARGGTTMLAKLLLTGVSGLMMAAIGLSLAQEPTAKPEKKPEVKAEVKATVPKQTKPKLVSVNPRALRKVQTLGWLPDGKTIWIHGYGIYPAPGNTFNDGWGVFFFTRTLNPIDKSEAPFWKPNSVFLGFSSDYRTITVRAGVPGKINSNEELLAIPVFDSAGNPVPKPNSASQTEPTVTVPLEAEYGDILGFTNGNKSFVSQVRGKGTDIHKLEVVVRSVETGEVEETLLKVEDTRGVFTSRDFSRIAREVRKEQPQIEVRNRGTNAKTWTINTPMGYEIRDVNFTEDGKTLLVTYQHQSLRDRLGGANRGGGPPDAEKKKPPVLVGVVIGYDTDSGQEVFNVSSSSHDFYQLQLSHDRKLLAARTQTVFDGNSGLVGEYHLVVLETATGKPLKKWPLLISSEEARMRRSSPNVHWAFSPTEPILLIAEPGEKADTMSLGLWEFPTSKK